MFIHRLFALCMRLLFTNFLQPTVGVNSCDYDTAEVLYITFVNNNGTKEENKMAEAWEKAFIEFVSTYNATYIKVHYSAEVSKARLSVT